MADHPGAARAEQAAALMTAAGMPRMPARALMALVGSPDDGYTAAELAERLGVSAAAVSGAVRYLETLRMIHRISTPGSRVVRYDLIDDSWHSVVMGGLPLYLKLAEHVDAIAGENTAAPLSVRRAREMADFFRYMSEQMPLLLEEWERRRTNVSREPPGSAPVRLPLPPASG